MTNSPLKSARPFQPIEGLSLHGMTVDVSTPEELTVIGSTQMSVMAIACGILLIGLGIPYWNEVLEARGRTASNHQQVNVKMLSLPLIGLFAVGYGANQWARRID